MVPKLGQCFKLRLFMNRINTMSTRNSIIYLIIAAAALFLVSRIVTVALMLMYAPEDSESFFYLKQALFAVVAAGFIPWLWSKRVKQRAGEEREDESDIGR